MFGRPLVLKTMLEFFYFKPADMSTAPVWVRFPNLPLECCSSICLSKIASVLGKPLQWDASTNSMSRLSFAKVLIEVDLLADLPNSITFILPNGIPLSQFVVYGTLPKLCPQCRLTGHTISACPQTAAARGESLIQLTPQ